MSSLWEQTLSSERCWRRLIATGPRRSSFAVAAAYAVLTLSFPFENRLFAMGVSRALIVPKAIGAPVNIAAAVLIVPTYGALGAGLANLAGQVALLAGCVTLWWVMILATLGRWTTTA